MKNLRAMLSISGYLSGPLTFNLLGVELLWRCKQRHSTANDQSSPNNRFPVPLSRVWRAISSFFLSPIPRAVHKDRSSPSNPFSVSLSRHFPCLAANPSLFSSPLFCPLSHHPLSRTHPFPLS